MTDPTRARSGGPPWRRADWLGFAVFSAAALSAALWLMILGRGLTFFFDEWDFVDASATTGYWHAVLQPHNGHPSMIPFSVYEVLLHTVGLQYYWPYRLLLVLLDVGCGWLLFVLLRRRVHPVAAGAAAALLLLLGPAWQDLLWPFQIGFLGSVAGGLGALVLLDRNTRRADVGACACLAASVACSGVGLPFLAGVAVELAWRRRSWLRLWVPYLPLGLFVVWYETIGRSSSSTVSPVTLVHSMASDTATTVGALVGGGTTVGAVLSGALAALVIAAVVRSPGQAARLAMAVTGLLTFWVLTLVARGVSQNSASRYLYPAAALVLIAGGELPELLARTSRGRLPDDAPAWARFTAAAALVGVVAFAGVAVWWNSGALSAGSDGLAGVSAQVRSELGMVALAGSALPGNFRPDQTLMPQVTVGPYLKAVDEFGPAGASPADIIRPGNPSGSTLDAMLLRGRPMQIAPVDDPAGIPIVAADCLRSPIGSGNPTVTFTLPRRGAVVTAPNGADLTVRVKAVSARFPSAPIATIAPDRSIVLRWSTQPTRVHWSVRLTPVPAPAPAGSVATVCPVRPGPGARSTGPSA